MESRRATIIIVMLLGLISALASVRATQLIDAAGRINYVAINESVVADEDHQVDLEAPPKRLNIPIVVNVEKQENDEPGKPIKPISISQRSGKDASTKKPTTVKANSKKVYLEGTSPSPYASPSPPTLPPCLCVCNCTSPKSSGMRITASVTLLVFTSLMAGIILEFANKKIMV